MPARGLRLARARRRALCRRERIRRSGARGARRIRLLDGVRPRACNCPGGAAPRAAVYAMVLLATRAAARIARVARRGWIRRRAGASHGRLRRQRTRDRDLRRNRGHAGNSQSREKPMRTMETPAALYAHAIAIEG